eukprot:g20495.t1
MEPQYLKDLYVGGLVDGTVLGVSKKAQHNMNYSERERMLSSLAEQALKKLKERKASETSTPKKEAFKKEALKEAEWSWWNLFTSAAPAQQQ